MVTNSDGGDRLVRFLYILARDYLPFGTIASIVEKAEKHRPGYADANQCSWATEMAERLDPDE